MVESTETMHRMPPEQLQILEVSEDVILKMEKTLSALANEDALKIFLYAKNGITNSTEAISRLGLTQKRYYVRLKLLLEAGLLEKTEDTYEHTYLGSIFHKYGLVLMDMVAKEEELKLYNSLNKSSSLSDKDKRRIAKALSLDVPLPETRGAFRIVYAWEDLVSMTVVLVEEAKESLYLASQYLDTRVLDAGCKAIDRGVKIRGLISETEQLSNSLKLLFSMLTNPKELSLLLSTLKSDKFPLRITKLPYTFLVVDGKKCVLEIKNPATDVFQYGFMIDDESISEKMIETFESLWKTASEPKDKIKIL